VFCSNLVNFFWSGSTLRGSRLTRRGFTHGQRRGRDFRRRGDRSPCLAYGLRARFFLILIDNFLDDGLFTTISLHVFGVSLLLVGEQLLSNFLLSTPLDITAPAVGDENLSVEDEAFTHVVEMLHVCINLALLYLIIEQFVDQPALDILLEHGSRPILQLFFQDGCHIQQAVNPPHFL